MWFPMTLRARRPHESAHGRRASRAGYGLLFPLFLLPALLSGCGGGGSGINSVSTSDQGFRIVPAGGAVVPLADGSGSVTLTTDANAVSAGVQMSAARLDLTAQAFPTVPGYLRSAPTGASTTVPISAYQITFSPDGAAISAPAKLALAYQSLPPALPPNSTLRIYRYDGKQWITLPGAGITLTTTTASGTVTASLETQNPQGSPAATPYLTSGIYAVFATAPPAAPAL